MSEGIKASTVVQQSSNNNNNDSPHQQSLVSRCAESGIQQPQHVENSEKTPTLDMKAQLLPSAPSPHDDTAPPQSPAPAMNSVSEVGEKRPVEDGVAPSEAKRIKVEVDLPNNTLTNVQTKVEVLKTENSKEQDKPNLTGSITPPLSIIDPPSSSATKEAPPQDAAAAAASATTDAAAAPENAPATPERKVGDEAAPAPVVSPKDSTRTSSSTSAASSSFSSTSSSNSTAPPSQQPAMNTQLNAPPSPPLPLKATQMQHLRKKYLQELEYMLREFRKLERQLLGAKGNGVEESSGSRERREKLHSFIMHLDDTIRQIEVGCRLQSEGKSTTATTGEEERQQAAESVALSNLTKEKEEEENVSKLEEHILANLLPVKVRLKKQLAAQQGATRNPIGMPAARQGLQPSTAADKGKGTFAAAAEERRKQAEAARVAAQEQSLMAASAASQFGKPLSGGGSSLTQKLHGSTLGSQRRKHGHGVGVAEAPLADTTEEDGDKLPERKILYGGMAVGSKQHQSGVSAAVGAHKMVIESPDLKLKAKPPPAARVVCRPPPKATPHPSLVPPKPKAKPYNDPNLTEEEQKKMRKERRKRKKARELRRLEKERQRQLYLQQQAAQAVPKGPMKKVGKIVKGGPGKKKGPRSVEYICALCSEAYNSSCDYNPWWALASHECPKCRKSQVPRIDITSPANAIEYHPALLAHAEEGGGQPVGMPTPPPNVMQHHMNPHPYRPPGANAFPPMYPFSDTDEESDLSELSDATNLSEDSDDSDGSEDDLPLTEGELAELEVFGKEYDGPKLTPDQASRFLILMGHAQTCPGRHKAGKHRDCCNSVKYLMLHVRDCPGTTSTFDVCPFPWCRKVKHLLYHLVACPRPRDCAICSPIALSPHLKSLIGLNSYRRKKHRERMKAVMAQAAAAAKAKPPPPKVSYVTKSSKPATYRPPVTHKKTTVSKYKAPTSKALVASRITPIARAKPITIRATSSIKPTNGVVVKSLVKPLGRSSVVVVKARPKIGGVKPTVAALGAKPTVAALPCVKPIVVSTTKPSQVVSSIVPKVLETIPLPVKPITISVARAPQPVTSTVQPKSSADVVKANAAAAQAALAVNALEQAAKVAMEDSAPAAVPAPVPAPIQINPQAVAVASAIAASMVTPSSPPKEAKVGETTVAAAPAATVSAPAAKEQAASGAPSEPAVAPVPSPPEEIILAPIPLKVPLPVAAAAAATVATTTETPTEKRTPDLEPVPAGAAPATTVKIEEAAVDARQSPPKEETPQAPPVPTPLPKEETPQVTAPLPTPKEETPPAAAPASPPAEETPQAAAPPLPISPPKEETPQAVALPISRPKEETPQPAVAPPLPISPPKEEAPQPAVAPPLPTTLSPKAEVSSIQEEHASPPRFPEVPAVVNEEPAEETKTEGAPKEVPPV